MFDRGRMCHPHPDCPTRSDRTTRDSDGRPADCNRIAANGDCHRRANGDIYLNARTDSDRHCDPDADAYAYVNKSCDRLCNQGADENPHRAAICHQG